MEFFDGAERNGTVGSVPPATRSGRLRHLVLSRNALSGTIPPELGNLAALRQLRLRDNSISGTLPGSLRANAGAPAG